MAEHPGDPATTPEPNPKQGIKTHMPAANRGSSRDTDKRDSEDNATEKHPVSSGTSRFSSLGLLLPPRKRPDSKADLKLGCDG